MSGRDDFSGVERAEERCALCSALLAEAQAGTFAALYPEGEGFRRRDYCAPCFEKLPHRPFSFWRRVGAAKAASARGGKDERREKRRRDLDGLLELFASLASPAPDAREHAEKLRYLLALALVRKKRLHLVELARAGGADCLILRASGEAELLTVRAPTLSKEDLDRLARELEAEVGLS